MPHYRLHRDSKSSHQQISTLLRRIGNGPVLDVGAAQGMLGQLLTGSGVTMDAVEMNPEWAQACKPYYRSVLVGMIEDAPVPDEKYRVIVCADVLEHTTDPVSVLQKVQRVAADDAIYIVSVPNVAHIAVRMMLLFGKFPKMERGVLDKTHYQFFTRKTAIDMLGAAGLSVVAVSQTGVPLDEMWPKGEGSFFYSTLIKIQHVAIAVLPKLFAMQFVFTARRTGAKTLT
jgi:2-polyprenyl-3-methyl-5-hydroxy-6-metoxy-1,4-benzoquinol methylase